MADIARLAGSAVSFILVSKPAALYGKASLIVMADEDTAVRVARRIARETGRDVTVRDADMALIVAIPAASAH